MSGLVHGVSSFFFIDLKPRVEWYTKSMRLKYEPASEPLHISVECLFSWCPLNKYRMGCRFLEEKWMLEAQIGAMEAVAEAERARLAAEASTRQCLARTPLRCH